MAAPCEGPHIHAAKKQHFCQGFSVNSRFIIAELFEISAFSWSFNRPLLSVVSLMASPAPPGPPSGGNSWGGMRTALSIGRQRGSNVSEGGANYANSCPGAQTGPNIPKPKDAFFDGSGGWVQGWSKDAQNLFSPKVPKSLFPILPKCGPFFWPISLCLVGVLPIAPTPRVLWGILKKKCGFFVFC